MIKEQGSLESLFMVMSGFPAYSMYSGNLVPVIQDMWRDRVGGMWEACGSKSSPRNEESPLKSEIQLHLESEIH